MRWLALLRGVNVGGKRKLPMHALEGAFMLTGATVVTTYIQSGNVVFESDRPAEACAEAAEAVEERFGFRPVVIHRSEAAWRTMIAKNPFIAAGIPVETLHVACLEKAPAPAASAALDPKAFLPDEFALGGADIYLRLPNGVARSVLTNAVLDRAFGTVSTMRNWRTAIRLLELLAE
jgi:uncharacterized protein (DUF1697 family)